MDDARSSKEDDPFSGDHFLKSPWSPSQRAFRTYSLLSDEISQISKTSRSRVTVRRSLVTSLTKDIVQTYKKCNPEFKYSEASTPKRFLTSPSIGVLNNGCDNANSDLILNVNYILVNPDSQRRYIVKDILGHGTFGQVAKCLDLENNNYVAVKIIKNQRAYFQQARVEIYILKKLNKEFDPDDRHHIVRILDSFKHQDHLCISFELLYLNLYELIKMNKFRGLPLSIIQVFSKQILSALILMKDAGIIHCDLKPENILLSNSVKTDKIKIIDFGSACMEDQTVYTYIQSRYYRSPEVLLGCQYTTAIDMWSFGCIIAELFLGIPLFPGASEFDLLKRMIKILGEQPPDHVLNEAKNTKKFFKCVHCPANVEAPVDGKSAYQLLTEEEYEARELKKPLIGKQYFGHMKLEEIVTCYNPKDLPEDGATGLALFDFLRGIFQVDPVKRWSPLQASKHPFVTGEPFKCPYKPTPETPRIPVSPNVRVDHHPGVRHLSTVGVTPQISIMKRSPALNSPQVAPFSSPSSYGSFASRGSCAHAAGFGSSYGSYGDNSSVYSNYSPVGPSGFNHRISTFEASPNTRRITYRLPHGNGFDNSPSTGNFGQMSLGASPSQSTPNSHLQILVGSPGTYSPTSQARCSGVHGSPFGKVSAISQFNRRHCGYPGTFPIHSRESEYSPNWRWNQTDGVIFIYTEENSQGHGISPQNVQTRGSGFTSGFSSPKSWNPPGPFEVSSNIWFPPTSDAAYSNPEYSSAPDPGHWDPNYSDNESLLQEDISEMSSLATVFTNGMDLSNSSNSAVLRTEIGRLNPACFQTQISSNMSYQRTNEPVQAYMHVEGSRIPSACDIQAGYGYPLSKPLHLMNHLPQNSPSRFGQCTYQQSNHGRTSYVQGSEWNHPMVQTAMPFYNDVRPHSSGNSTFSNGSSWGQRTVGHPIGSMPPMYHAKNNYGRIA